MSSRSGDDRRRPGPGSVRIRVPVGAPRPGAGSTPRWRGGRRAPPSAGRPAAARPRGDATAPSGRPTSRPGSRTPPGPRPAAGRPGRPRPVRGSRSATAPRHRSPRPTPPGRRPGCRVRAAGSPPSRGSTGAGSPGGALAKAWPRTGVRNGRKLRRAAGRGIVVMRAVEHRGVTGQSGQLASSPRRSSGTAGQVSRRPQNRHQAPPTRRRSASAGRWNSSSTARRALSTTRSTAPVQQPGVEVLGVPGPLADVVGRPPERWQPVLERRQQRVQPQVLALHDRVATPRLEVDQQHPAPVVAHAADGQVRRAPHQDPAVRQRRVDAVLEPQVGLGGQDRPRVAEVGDALLGHVPQPWPPRRRRAR